MAPEKSPAFQFYPKDFLTDERVGLMSYTERGIYITLLSKCWLEGSLPASMTALAKLLDVPIVRFRKLWDGPLKQCFMPAGEGRISQKRLEHERRKQESHRTERSVSGSKGAAKRWHKDGSATKEPLAKNASSFSSSVSDLRSSEKRRESLSPAAPHDPFTDDKTTDRAGRFLERYQELYPEHRHGARYALKPARDYAAAVTLCQTWADDERLDKLAVLFLTTDHKFAEEGSRTVPQFLALASWCDGRLAEWEAKRKAV